MSKKDYIRIAGALNRAKNAVLRGCDWDMPRTIERVVDELAYELQRDNYKFDVAKFKQAVNN